MFPRPRFRLPCKLPVEHLTSALCPLTSVLPIAYWEHTPHPFIIRFTENIGLRYYGLAYFLGFVAAVWLLHRYHQARRTSLDLGAALDLMFYLVAGVIVGGRLGSYLLYDGWRTFSADPLGILKLWEGGMASHGGMAGVVVGLWLFARSRKVPFLHVADLVVTTAPVGLFLGRVANFLNGELWGKVTDVSWAVIFAKSGGGPDPRHPSQLYEAGLEGLLLLAWLQWRFWKTNIAERSPGRLAGEFLLGYAAVRIFCEVFREPDRDVSLILGLSRGTFFSLFLAAAGLWLILRVKRT